MGNFVEIFYFVYKSGDIMYEMDLKVRFSDCDSEKNLTYNGIVNCFQDCTNRNSETLGVGLDYLNGKNKAWIMLFWQIVINRRPVFNEEVKVATWATGFQGFMGERNFTLKDEDGNMLVCANSYWLYMDTKSGRPSKIPPEEAEKYSIGPKLDIPDIGMKLRMPEDAEQIDTIQIRKHYIDVYQHMNNGRYIELASDYLPDGIDVKQICCQYKKQIKKDEIVTIYRKIEEQQITIVMKEEDTVHAIVEFSL